MTCGPILFVCVALCALSGAACGANVDLGGTTPGDTGVEAGTCDAFAVPDAGAPCEGCQQGSSGCQANGCFNGYFCDVTERDCKAPGTPCPAARGDAR